MIHEEVLPSDHTPITVTVSLPDVDTEYLVTTTGIQIVS